MKTSSKAGIIIISAIIISVLIVLVPRLILGVIYGVKLFQDEIKTVSENCLAEKEIINALELKNISYIPQSIDGINYNNISGNSEMPLITPKGIFYSKHGNAKHYFYMLCETGEIRLFSHNLSGDIQLYENDLYFDCSDSIVKYNITKKDKCILAEFDDYTVRKYYVLNEFVYVMLTSTTNPNTTCLSMVSCEDGKIIEISQGVVSIGVIDNQPAYVIQDDNGYSLYLLNPSNHTPSLIKTFNFDIYNGDILKSVNYTSEQIIFLFDDGNVSKLVLCDKNGATERKFEFKTYTAIAFDEYIFLDGYSEFTQKTTLYKLRISTGELSAIQSFDGYINFSVFSDEEMFVSSSSFDGIRKYTTNGDFSSIYKKIKSWRKRQTLVCRCAIW